MQRAARGPHASADRPGAENLPAEQDQDADQELIKAERHAALREAFTHLPADGQQLIALLIADPPLPYAEISARLGIPVGSIGPTRSRCLAKMRRHPALAALINAESVSPPAGHGRGQLNPGDRASGDARRSGRPGPSSSYQSPR